MANGHPRMELSLCLLGLASGHDRNIDSHSPSKSCSQSISSGLCCREKTLARPWGQRQWLWPHPEHSENSPTSVSLLVRKCSLIYKPASYFASFCVVFFLLGTKQFGQPKICDLDMLWGLHQDISGCQVTVHQAPVFQVVHALKRGAMQGGKALLSTLPWRVQSWVQAETAKCSSVESWRLPVHRALRSWSHQTRSFPRQGLRLHPCVVPLMDTVTCTLHQLNR